MSRRGRQLIVLALMLLYLLPAPYAAVHVDLARDMYTGWRIVTGEAYPTMGPVIASTFHLGPVWYYLLAASLWLTQSWFGTILLMALLSALQMPAAYLAGKALHSRAVGLLWAVLLLMPAWSTFEQVLPTHTQLIAPLALATLAAMLRFYRTRKFKYLLASGLAFGLALHAHPTTMMLAIPGALMLVWAWRARAWSWPAMIAAGLLALLPFSPFILVQIASGFDDVLAVADYLGASQSLGKITATPALLAAIVHGGPHYWFNSMLGWSAGWANLIAASFALIVVAGVIGCLRQYRNPELRHMAWIAPSMVVLSAIGVVLIRDPTSFYMTTIVRVLLLGVVAVGITRVARAKTTALVVPIVVSSVIAANLAVLVGIIQFQTRGAWPFSFIPMFEVKAAPVPATPFPLLPAYAMAPSGEYLCAPELRTVHGTYGTHLLLHYAIEGRIACSQPNVVVGGADSTRQHWLGLSRRMLRQAGLRTSERIGPFGLFRVERVFDRAVPHVLPAEPIYPPLANASAPHIESYAIEMRDGDWIAVTNVAFAFSNQREVTLRLDGLALPPRAQDLASTLYYCDACADGKTRVAQLSVMTSFPHYLDIVRFQSP